MTTPSFSQAFGLDRKLPNVNPHIKHFDFRIGEPKLSPFPFDIFGELHQEKNINCYYPSHGDPALREMIVKKFYSDQTLENIAITHGTLGALDTILRATLERESEVLIPNPGFPPYARLSEFNHAKVKRYQLDLDSTEQSVYWEHLESLITEKTKIIIFNTPNNPTGRVFSKKDFSRFQRLLEHFPHVNFIMDEIYRELLYDQHEHFDYTPFIDRGYIVSSFSKMYPLQGARIGWVLTSSEKLQLLAPYFNNATASMSSFGQEIAKAVLKRNLSFHELYIKARKTVTDILDSYHVEYVIPEGAFFVFIKYDMDGGDVCEQLSQLGISVVPGGVFGSLGDNFIRVSFAQNEGLLKEGLSKLAQHWLKSKSLN